MVPGVMLRFALGGAQSLVAVVREVPGKMMMPMGDVVDDRESGMVPPRGSRNR